MGEASKNTLKVTHKTFVNCDKLRQMKIFNSILVVLILTSCKGDDDHLMNCLGIPNDLFFESCSSEPFETNQICDYEYIGSYKLHEESHQYLPQFCLEPNSEIEYTNVLGEIISFQVIDKRYFKSNIGSNTGIPCELDSLKTKGICIDNEMVLMRLKSFEKEIEFAIQITTQPDIRNLDSPGVGDFLIVNRGDFTISQVQDFRYVIQPRTLSYDKLDNQEFHEFINLNDKTYDDVISTDITKFSFPKIKFYFSKNKGLIGFVDLDNILWTLIE